MIQYSENGSAIEFRVRVIPRASKSEVVGEFDGCLKARIAAPPVDGAANEEVIKLMAKAFGQPRGHVEILAGRTSKTKRVRVNGGDVRRLLELAAG